MNAAATERFSSSVLLLALCPLLAVSDTVVSAFGLGIAVLIIVTVSSALMTLIRGVLSEENVLAASLLLLAGVIGCIELLMRAWLHDMHESLGIFLPLIVSNLVIVEHLQARPTPPGRSMVRGLKLALSIVIALLVLGFARELVGRGSLLHGADSVLGPWARQLEMKVFSVDMGFLLAMLPPGAFISLGLALAARNWISARRSANAV
jgi:Na+-translocating ferredoxin:NAD+ oxidoreductase subunit E